MHRIILIIALFFPFFLFGQSEADFTKIDQIAREAPDEVSNSINELARYLTVDAETDIQKVRAIYVWVTENIRYDINLFYDDKITSKARFEKQQAERVLKYKRGVCEGYTNLFHELCVAANIPSEKVNGYSKNPKGKVSKLGHTWNVVRIDGNWFLIESSWGAGSVDIEKRRFHQKFKEEHFLMDPEIFVLHHYPNDPLFQLSDKPVTWDVFQKNEDAIKAFVNGGQSRPDFIHFQDSLNYLHELEPDAKLLNSVSRILCFDPNNGYANYNASRYYFDEARKDFELYLEEMKPFMENIQKLQEEDIQRWAALMEVEKGKLKRSKSYIDAIQPGDKFYGNAATAKKSINVEFSNIRKVEKQLGQFRDFLKKIRN